MAADCGECVIISNGHIIDSDTGFDKKMDLFISGGRIISSDDLSNFQFHNHNLTETETETDSGHATTSGSGSLVVSTLAQQHTDTDNETKKSEPSTGLLVDTDTPPRRPPVCSSSRRVFDATGCYVTAGLVDCHLHAYQYATPLGIDVDHACLARGVTATVDAGSAGSGTFLGLKKLIAEQRKARLFAFVHIANHGLAAVGCSGLGTGGECDSLNAVDVKTCCDVINKNRDVVVGVKVRLAASVADEGKNEQEIYRRSLEASKESKVPLMVHHALSTVCHEESDDLLGCPGSLRKGDIYTHCFHGHAPHICDLDTGKVKESVWDAKRRGVLFDVGHGQGSFSWRLAEQCASEGFWPDTISTDLHTESQEGPAYDLMCVMTKMLHLGMPVNDVIKAVTWEPAKAIGKSDEIGSLRTGRRADVTVLKLVDLDPPVALEDSFGETRDIRRAFMPVAVFLDGLEFPVVSERQWPNAETVEQCRARVSQYRAK